MATLPKPAVEASQYTRPSLLRADLAAHQATPFESRPTTRLVPMRLLVLGLCRTGTSSLRWALFQLGYADVHHMSSLEHALPSESNAWLSIMDNKDNAESMTAEQKIREHEFWNRLTGGVEAVCDVPASLFPEELLRCYPDAKVVLTVRGPSEAETVAGLDKPKHLQGAKQFATSTQATLLQMRSRTWWMQEGFWASAFVAVMPLPRQVLVRREVFQRLLRIAEERPGEAMGERLERVYETHNERVMRLCREQGREVLVYNVAEGWGPLVEFLGEVQVPRGDKGEKLPFPRLNDTATFHRIAGAKIGAMKEKARREMREKGTIFFGAGVVCVLAWRFWRLSNRS